MIKKMIFGALASLTLMATPAVAQEDPPAGTELIPVTLGVLEAGNYVVITNTKTGAKIRVQLTGCDENWATNDPFLFIKSKNGYFFVVRSKRFFYYWNYNRNWNYALDRVVADNALCQVVL